jgi:DNA-binding beta-propeller fold protein YncE
MAKFRFGDISVRRIESDEISLAKRARCILLGFTAACSLSIGARTAWGDQARPNSWSKPEIVVAPSSFTGVHGLAIDRQGRLLAASVIGNQIWEVDRDSGAARVFIDSPEGQADDIAVSEKGELAWTGFFVGEIRYRANDTAPIRVLARNLPGINSIDFDRSTGKLYASQCFLGDGLWEIDITGSRPPRPILKDIGGLNGFEVGPDHMIYGPLWYKNQVVKIDPGTGTLTVISSDFAHPAAVNLDGKGNLWVVETPSGQLSKVALSTGKKTVMARFKTGVDNLAISPEGTIYVSNFDDNAIYAFDPDKQSSRVLTSGALSVPAGLKLSGGLLWVADFFSFRKVDPTSGKVEDVMRTWDERLRSNYATAIGVSDKLVTLSSWFSKSVQVLDRESNETLAFTEDWKSPYDTLPLPDGSVLVLQIGEGTVTRMSGPSFGRREIIASGLVQPVQMALGRDHSLYVTETRGDLIKIDLGKGTQQLIASNLGLPEGLAETPWGSWIIADGAGARLIEISIGEDKPRIVAGDLPIGLPASPGMWRAYVPTGVAVSANGTVYFAANRNNAIYRIRPK